MSYVGLHATDGSLNVTVVPGTSYTGFYAADGSMNVIQSDGVSTYVGAYHPCGAIQVSRSGGTLAPRRAANGSLRFNTVSAKDGSQPVTVITGTLT